MNLVGTKGRMCVAAIFAAMAVGALALTLPGAFVAAGPAAKADSLAKVEADVDANYPDVAQLSAAGLAAAVKTNAVLLFDVREASEYRVSRIKGAVRIAPGTWSSSFLAAQGSAAKGKFVVFYCSVGVRSSKLASRVQEALLKRGALRVYNLRGGIFRWHNEARALVNDRGATAFVHAYDNRWGRLVDRQHLTRYSPTN